MAYSSKPETKFKIQTKNIHTLLPPTHPQEGLCYARRMKAKTIWEWKICTHWGGGAFNWFALNFFTKFLYVKLQASYKMKMKVTDDNQFNTMITAYSFCSSVEGKHYLKKTI